MERNERGASAVEYGLLLAGVAAVIAATFLLFGGVAVELFTDSCTVIETATGGSGTCP